MVDIRLPILLSITVLLAAGLAGCADSGASEPTSDLPPPKEVEATKTKGAISGVVVTETIVPIAGAILALTGTELSSTTDENGLFIFEELEPGTYFMEISAEGHIPVQQNVAVEAGKVSNPRVMLPFDNSPKPYHQSFQFNGHMVVSDFYGVYILTDELGNNDLCTCVFEFTSSAKPTTVVVEGVWESSTVRATDHEFYWEIWTDNSGTQTHWSGSPTLWHVNGDVFGADTEWGMQVSSDAQPDVEQEFEGFVTFFYVEPAPSGWSLVGGDT